MDFVAKFINGKIKFVRDNAKASFMELLHSLGESETMFKISVDKIGKETTDKQLNLLKRIILTVCNDTGEDYKAINEELRDRFYPKEVKINMIGNEIITYTDFSDWTNGQFNEVLEKSIEFCNDFFSTNLYLHQVDDKTILTNKK